MKNDGYHVDRKTYVYQIINKLNNKHYIGVSYQPDKRWSQHKSTARPKTLLKKYHLHHAMTEHLENINDIFSFEIIKEFNNSKDAFDFEILKIAELKLQNINIYNETLGGEYPPLKFGEDNPFYGKHHSEETKKKISDLNKGKFAGDKNFFYGKSFSGEQHPLYGTQRPQHVKDALSKAHKGKVIPQELKDRWSINRSGEKHPRCKISDDISIEIYKMYYDEKISIYNILKAVFQKYNIKISESIIYNIKNCKNRFKNLKEKIK